jgi:hypothetical protein
MNTAEVFSKATERILHLLSKVIGKEAAGGFIQKLLAVVISVSVFAILVYTSAPEGGVDQELARVELEAQNKATSETEKVEAAKAALWLHFYSSGVASARLEPDGNSVTVYVTKSQFESIQFPDRKGFIERAGKLWCPAQRGLLPSLVVSDIRSGETLGNYSCTTGWVSMP